MTAENRPPARNAMKHGLCSHLFLAQENAGHVNEIREELIRCYKPKIDEEERLINELAFAQFKVFHNEHVRYERIRDERINAGKIYDSQAKEAHEKLAAQWRAEPGLNLLFMKNDPFGVNLFMNHWSDILALAEAEKGSITLSQICDACLMLGSHWDVQRLTRQGRRLMGLYLALQARPEDEVETWVDRCGSTNREKDIAIGQEIYTLAPGPEQARQELAELAREQVRQLESDKTSAASDYEYARAQFIEKSDGHGLGDKARTTEARLFMRYHTADQRRADRLERQLGSLKRTRARHGLADAQESAYDAKYMTITPTYENPDTGNHGMHIQEHAPAEPIPQPEPVSKPARPKLSFAELDKMMREMVVDKLMERASIAKPLAEGGDDGMEFENGGITSAAFSRMPEFRNVEWADRAGVEPWQADILIKCHKMDAGPERSALLKKYFGKISKLNRAYDQYMGQQN